MEKVSTKEGKFYQGKEIVRRTSLTSLPVQSSRGHSLIPSADRLRIKCGRNWQDLHWSGIPGGYTKTNYKAHGFQGREIQVILWKTEKLQYPLTITENRKHKKVSQKQGSFREVIMVSLSHEHLHNDNSTSLFHSSKDWTILSSQRSMIHLYNSQQTYWIDSFIPDYIRSYHQPHIKWHPYNWYLNLLLMYQSGSSQDRENTVIWTRKILYKESGGEGGGIRMGNTCKAMADSCQCMTKTTTIL